MESLAVKLFAEQYRGRRVLVTGHTGFKGSWLALWLSELGAEVTGLALPPNTIPNHWSLLDLDIPQYLQDIRDAETVSSVVREIQPEIVFHLAAQPLVRQSYRNPLETWSTNVMGTANLLEACRKTPSVRAVVVATTDKCYENTERSVGYLETDRLGGHDPYSASKAATELVAANYRSAFFHLPDAPLLATARAGNVIGGGDWSEDRLIPDLVRAIVNKTPLEIRSPKATRPWQHVLESLSGYLMLGQKLLEKEQCAAEGWNFGPEPECNRAVTEVLAQLKMHWPELSWQEIQQPQPHEATLLNLDCTKAKTQLGWRPVWTFDETLTATANWYRNFCGEGKVKSHEQLASYISAAQASGIEWGKA
jgi:CDP-glucose 4,6-dehydratase